MNTGKKKGRVSFETDIEKNTCTNYTKRKFLVNVVGEGNTSIRCIRVYI